MKQQAKIIAHQAINRIEAYQIKRSAPTNPLSEELTSHAELAATALREGRSVHMVVDAGKVDDVLAFVLCRLAGCRWNRVHTGTMSYYHFKKLTKAVVLMVRSKLSIEPAKQPPRS